MRLNADQKKVVITGLGVVAPNGIGQNDFFNALISGRSGITKIDRFDVSSFPCKIAGQVRDFDPLLYIPRKKCKRMGKATQFAVAASRMAFEDAGLHTNKVENSRIGVSIGVGSNQLDVVENVHITLKEQGVRRMLPYAVESAFPNAAAGQVSIELGLKGPMLTFSTACASGINAIGAALTEIQNGNADVMVAGGTESTITPLGLAGFCAARVLSTNRNPEKASRPFDKLRDGLIMSEGAGMVVMESMEHAIGRGAWIYGEIVGYANVSGSYGMTHPDGSGDSFIRAMKLALSNAAISHERVDLINAHGVSAHITDASEAKAIREVFGQRTTHIPVTSIKSMIGQPFSATGPLQIIASCLMFAHKIIPATINYEYPDEECDLFIVANCSTGWEKLDTILVNAFGYGGINVCIILARVASQNDRRLRYLSIDFTDRRNSERRQKKLSNITKDNRKMLRND